VIASNTEDDFKIVAFGATEVLHLWLVSAYSP
jgi:hypothetical protein